ncbi:MAG: manganese efflux pump MntP family protein [Candidatus Dormibacteria bacterium]
MTRHVLVLAGLILPLSLDTFALAAALGVVGIPAERRRRTSLVLAAFEAGMPIVGFFIGGAVGHVIGYFAGWTAIAFLVVAGALMLRPGDEDKEEGRLRLLARAQGFAVVDLGLAISVDELAIGFSIGLLGLPLLVAVAWIGVQAFAAAELGMRVGARIGEELRERAEQLGGVALIAMAGVLVALKLAHGSV